MYRSAKRAGRVAGRPVFGAWWAGLILAVSVVPAGAAWSDTGSRVGDDDEPRSIGRVLRIDGPEAYIDLGHGDGARAGVEVTLYRIVTAIDPRTGARLEDRFRLVAVPVVEAGEVLSLVRVPPDLAPLLNVGDEARLPGAPAPVRTALDDRVPARLDDSPVDVVPAQPDLEDLGRAFSEAAGADFERRLSAWRGFVEKHPESDLIPVVSREIAALEGALRQPRPEATPPIETKTEAPPMMAVTAPRMIVEGDDLRVVATSTDHRVPSIVLIHFRRPEHESFRFKEMRRFGDGAFAAEIPSAMLEQPHVEWYVTAINSSGEHRVQANNRHTIIESPVLVASPTDRSRVNLAFQYVDFYRFKQLDAYSQFEADFLYRILYPSRMRRGSGPQIYSLRVGFGAFHGIGGSVERVAAADARGNRIGLRNVGFNFGYSELEIRFTENFAFMGRGIVGIGDGGLETGAQGSFRLGPEFGTNFVFGALNIGEIGQAWHLQLAWDTVPKVPMSASVEVTTWPVGAVGVENLGVRLLYEARYRFTPWLEVGGRLGYGLRNINHGGMTLGVGTVFSW